MPTAHFFSLPCMLVVLCASAWLLLWGALWRPCWVWGGPVGQKQPGRQPQGAPSGPSDTLCIPKPRSSHITMPLACSPPEEFIGARDCQAGQFSGALSFKIHYFLWSPGCLSCSNMPENIIIMVLFLHNMVFWSSCGVACLLKPLVELCAPISHTKQNREIPQSFPHTCTFYMFIES